MSLTRCTSVFAVLSLLVASGAAHRLAGQATAPPRASQDLVNQAVAQARADHKAVLVKFGASWCGWCHRFDAFLADTTGVGAIMSAHYVTVGLVTEETPAKRELENPGSLDLMRAMGGGEAGLPFFFILDSAGRKIGDSMIMPDHGNVGHPNLPDEVVAFDDLLARTAPGITAAERGRVRAFLDRMAGRTAPTP